MAHEEALGELCKTQAENLYLKAKEAIKITTFTAEQCKVISNLKAEIKSKGLKDGADDMTISQYIWRDLEAKGYKGAITWDEAYEELREFLRFFGVTSIETLDVVEYLTLIDCVSYWVGEQVYNESSAQTDKPVQLKQSTTETRAERERSATRHPKTLEEELRGEAKVWRELNEERTIELLNSYTPKQVVYVLNIYREAMRSVSYRPVYDIVIDYLSDRDDAMDHLEDIAMILKIKPYEYEEDRDYFLGYDIGDYYPEILHQAAEIITLLGKSPQAYEIEKCYNGEQEQKRLNALAEADNLIARTSSGLVAVTEKYMRGFYGRPVSETETILQRIAEHNYNKLQNCETKSEAEALINQAGALTLSLTAQYTLKKAIDYCYDERTRKAFAKYFFNSHNLPETVRL